MQGGTKAGKAAAVGPRPLGSRDPQEGGTEDLEDDRTSGWKEGTGIALDQLVGVVPGMK